MTPWEKRIALLEAYETLTDKEEICLKEANFQSLAETQAKKARLLDAMEEWDDGRSMESEEREAFNARIGVLTVKEQSNAALLDRMKAENRKEFKSLGLRSHAASKIRKAYGSSDSVRARSLKDKA